MKKIFVLICLSFCLSKISHAQTLTDSLQAFYPFNGNANDESIHSNNGTVSSPTLIADRFSNANSAYDFNGTSDYITINNTLGNFGTSDFSISFWIKTTVSGTTRFIGKRPTCLNDNLWDIAVKDGVIRWVVNEAGGVNFIDNYGSEIVNDGNWHHIVCIRNTTTLKTYFDGMLDSSSVGTGVANLNNTADLEFGRSVCIGVDGTVQYPGGLDDIRIYNRALGDEEINTLYNEFPVSVEILAKSSFFKIYPNPSKGSITIENTDFSSEQLTIRIVDLLGREIYKKKYSTPKLHLATSQFGTSSIYFAKITDDKNRLLKIEKLIIRE